MSDANKNLSIFSTVLVLAAVVVSCGKAPEGAGTVQPITPPPQTITNASGTSVPASSSPVTAARVTCVTGQFSVRGRCINAYDFPTACSIAGGVFFTENEKQLCKTSFYSVYRFDGTNNNFFRLSSDNVTGPYAFNTGMTLMRGDILATRSIGGWGGTSSNQFVNLGFTVQIQTLDCDKISVDGSKDGEIGHYLNLPTGLMASDGAQLYLLGTESIHTMNNPGLLKVGFNAPFTAGSCAQARTEMKIFHCNDAAGAPFPCPDSLLR